MFLIFGYSGIEVIENKDREKMWKWG